MFQDFDTMNYDAGLLYHGSALAEDKFVQDSVHEKLDFGDDRNDSYLKRKSSDESG